MFIAVSELQIWCEVMSDLPRRAEGSSLPALLSCVLSEVHQNVASTSTDALSILQSCGGGCSFKCFSGAQVLHPLQGGSIAVGQLCEEILICNSVVVNTSRMGGGNSALVFLEPEQVLSLFCLLFQKKLPWPL